MQCNYNWQGDPLALKRDHESKIRREHQRYTILYPSDEIKKQEFKNSQQITDFLFKNAEQLGYTKWEVFDKKVVDCGTYLKITYSCKKKYCNAYLEYHYRKPDRDPSNPNIILREYFLQERCLNNRHRHVLKLSTHIQREKNIRQYLYDVPVEEKIESHFQYIKQKFNMHACHSIYLKDRVFWKFRNEDHMLKKLGEKKVTFRRKIEGAQTTILLLISQSMQDNYRLYGDMLCFDITYKLLKKKNTQKKHIGIGFFVGQDENSRIVLFGATAIHEETSANFVILFKFFFECVQTIPETILTDDQRALGNAIERLRLQNDYDYVHLLDWYHKMEGTKRAMQRQAYREQLFTLFCRLLKEPSKQVFKDITFEISEMITKPDILTEFLKYQDRYCLSKAPPKFFGFGISSTRAEAFNNLIKRWVPHQTNMSRLLFFVFRVQKRLINRMNTLNFINSELLKNILDQELLILANELEHLAWEQIRQHYEQSHYLEDISDYTSATHQLISCNYYKSIRYTKYDRNYNFNLMYDVRYECWRCECMNGFRTGLPCGHIIRVIREYGGCIGYYINERWLHVKANAKVKKASRPSIRSKRI